MEGNIHTHTHTHTHNYQFAVKLDGCVVGCNTLNDLSNKTCALDKTEDLNLSVFNMITGINEWKTLTKHISCKCKSKCYGRKCNANHKWNNDKCWWCECKNPKEHHAYKKDYFCNPATYCCKNGKYLASVIHDSVITCHEITNTTQTVQGNINERKSNL